MNSIEINELSKQIKSPVPFWFLNGNIDEWHIIREFEMMKEKGIDDVIVHPRYGQEVEYLSDEWFKIFGWCIREAKKNNMHIWIYDELNKPSGTAGMSVMDIGDEYKSKYLETTEYLLSDIDKNNFKRGLYVIAAAIQGGMVTKTQLVTPETPLDNLDRFTHIFNCALKYDKFYTDTLSKKAVDKFKTLTYDEYFNRFGDDFGKTIRAAFTDEPSIYWVSVGHDDKNLPYTTDFFETFEDSFNYSPAPLIPYLFYPGKLSYRFRSDYWNHAGNLFNERYHHNLGYWCREHGIIYTGHSNHEEPLRYQMRFQGSMFGTMKEQDIPGVDHLGKQTLGNNGISILGHKICSSQAHISGKSRCMSESFGYMGWDTTFSNLKRVTDWQYALGINMLIPHAIFHTISSVAKRENPPSFFYQSPHWEDFKYFSDYLKNLEKMLCGGKHICKVAIMYPESSLWATYRTDKKTANFEYLDNFLNSLTLELIKNQIDFDLINYDSLINAKLEDSKIKLADEAYNTFIVPPSPFMRSEEVELLIDIVNSGVKTTIFSRTMEPSKQNIPQSLSKAMYMRTEDIQILLTILKNDLDDDIVLESAGAEDIIAYRREKDGKRITFLVNRSEKHRKVTMKLKNHPEPTMFDPETGKCILLPIKKTGTKLQAMLRFQPYQSYFIISEKMDNACLPLETNGYKPVDMKNLTTFVPYNTAPIYNFLYNDELEIDVRTEPRYTPVYWEQNPPDFDKYAGIYKASINIECSLDNIRVIIDKDFLDCKLILNGKEISLNGIDPSRISEGLPVFLTDFYDVQAEVGDVLKQGTNTIEVHSPNKLSEPIRFVGDFHVTKSGKNITLVNKGEMNPFSMEMNYPFYSGTITYKMQFDLEEKCSSAILNMHDLYDCASVSVNGIEAGKRLWKPYVLEIGKYTKQGLNEIEIQVRNNMTNILLGNPRQMGLKKMPVLEVL